MKYLWKTNAPEKSMPINGLIDVNKYPGEKQEHVFGSVYPSSHESNSHGSLSNPSGWTRQ